MLGGWRFRFIASAAFAISLQAHAGNTLFVGAGAMTTGILKTTQSDSGETAPWSALMYPIEVSAAVWRLRPAIFGTPLGVGADGAQMRVIGVHVPFSLGLGPIDIKAGPGVWFQLIGGGGGNISLNNGTGTSTFSVPGELRITKLISIDVGLGVSIFGSFRIDLDGYVTGLLSGRRTFNAFLRLSYGIL